MIRSFKSIIVALSLVFISATNTLTGQEAIYDWQNDRTWTQGLDNEDESLISLKNHVQYNYTYEDGSLIYFKTIHRIYRVGNDEAVQSVNRIYIPVSEDGALVEVKARTISEEGAVVELDKSNIKEVKDDEAGNAYRIFAIEGAQVGGDVEYFYTVKTSASVFGREYFQFGFPSLNTSFRMTTPPNLKFDFKSYNGFSEIVQDQSDTTQNIYTGSSETVNPLRQEDFGSYNANRQRIDFKLSYNTFAGAKRLFTWSDAAKRVAGLIYPIAAEEKSAIDDLVKELKLKKLKDPLEQFAAIEHHVKTNFYIDDQANADAERINFIVSNKYGTERGFTRFFAGLAETLGLKHELVMTSDRTNTRFDGQFETWNYLTDYLLYLPESGKFMAPYNFAFRLGLWPAEFSATEGLFIKNQVFEGTSIATGSIKPIPEQPYTVNYSNMDVKVTFNDDLSENTIEVARKSNGYEGSFIKTNLHFANDEQKTELLKNLLEFVGPNEQFTDMAFEGDDLDYPTWADHITYKGKFTSQNFIEQAGEIVLFSAGNLIGAQSELYQEDERTNLVENDYNRGYLRKIEIDIPEGYTIQNPTDIDMKVDASDNGRVVYLFESSHEIKDGKLFITINEYYDQVFFPIERFEEFRKVINAAADWNKVVLVLQPN